MKRLSILLVLLLALTGAVFVQAQDTATPEPTVEPTVAPTTEPTVEPTIEPTAEPIPVWVRVVNFSPDTPAVDVWIDGVVAFSNVAASTSSAYQTYAAGAHTVALTATGAAVDPATTVVQDVEWNEGAYITVAAVGSTAGGTLKGVVAVDDFSPIPFGTARIWAYHAVEGLGILDVFAGDQLLVTELAFPGTFTDLNGVPNDGAFSVDVAAGTYDIRAQLTGDSAVTGLDTDNANDNTDTNTNDNTDTNTNDNATGDETAPTGLVNLPQFVLEAGQIYTIAVVGTVDAPTTFVTSQAGIALPQASALDIALSSPDFSVLAAAVAAADPAIGEMLSAGGDFTVFAPTNAAFDAFLSDMAMTTDDLFANPDLLNAVLRYHVVTGRNDAAALAVMNGQTVATQQGETIMVTVNETGGIVLNNVANVVSADIATSTGIVHAIDAVLVPPSMATSG